MRSLPRLNLTWLSCVAIAVATAACEDDAGTDPHANHRSDAASASDAQPTTLAAGPPRAKGIAVVNGSADYASVVISLVDPATNMVLKDNCISSGTMAPKLSQALSGDVALPSQPQPGNELLVIDSGQSALVWLDPATCAVLRQVKVAEFKAFPHDVVGLSPSKAYVLRYGDKDADGSDIAIVDPGLGKVTGTISLRAHATKDKTGASMLPKPDRALWVGGKIYVSLNNLSADFKSAGPGRLVVIDPKIDMISATIDLGGLENCGGLTYDEAANALAVACNGLFADGAKQIDGAGVAWVDLSSTPPTVKTVSATPFGRPVSGFRVAVASKSLAFTTLAGDFKAMTKDQLWSFDFVDGAPKQVFEASGPFVLGGTLLDGASKKLFVTDSSDKGPKMLVWNLTATGAMMAASFAPSNVKDVFSRSAGWY